MLTAEQLYFPASFPATFFNSSFPPDTVEGLICDRLFSLLHFITGLGLPFTEHWNEADPPSLTVSVLGDTATTGAEIDSPGSPLAPGMPAGPMSPFCPLSPTSPLGPDGPIIPCLPLFPANPIIPWSPFCPLLPRDPFFPLGPGGPGGPRRHELLCDNEWCCLNSDKMLSTVASTFLISVLFLIVSALRLFLWRLLEWGSEKYNINLWRQCHQNKKVEHQTIYIRLSSLLAAI